ncbi:MAG TPA: hypothetical protein VLD36_10885 [Burkholderiales bacterium]|jgi:hypothetical protein|nr:hypothetical protein [Burkholderiales bacterium]
MNLFAKLSAHQLDVAITFLERELDKLDRSATPLAAELSLAYAQQLDQALYELSGDAR